MANTADYDAPRRPALEVEDDGLDGLKTGRAAAGSPTVDVDETDPAAGFDLPGHEVLDDELSVAVVPMKADEFRCPRCFLVHHRSQLASQRNGETVCRECA
jgi:hypothetical protein